MMYSLLKQIARKKSLLRSLMNVESSKYTLFGKVLDLGGGSNSAHFTYYNYLKKDPNTEILNFDLKGNGKSHIDFETDLLPFEDNSVDQVLSFNLFEHIYNYRHIVSESARVLKPGSQMIGFVPFLINYHPDPNDYFRYTKEALKNIFNEAGFKEIKIKAIGLGPFAVNFNVISPFFPVIFRCLIFPFYYFADKLILKLRPHMTDRYPLGYFFDLRK